MQKLKLAAAAIVLMTAAFTTASASPVTFFGEDENGPVPTTPDPNILTSFPNSDGARNNFFSNLTNIETETFDAKTVGATAPLALTFPSAGTVTLNGTGSVETGNNGAGRYPISQANYWAADTGNFSVDFADPIAAFGFYGIDIGDFGGHLTLTLTDTNNVDSVLTVPNLISQFGEISGSVLYFGFYDTGTQYTKIAFGNDTQGIDFFAFDNMSIGSPAPVPEPSTFALLSSALAGLWLVRRRRRS